MKHHLTPSYQVTDYAELIAIFLVYCSDRILKLSQEGQNIVATAINIRPDMMLRCLKEDCPIRIIFELNDDLIF